MRMRDAINRIDADDLLTEYERVNVSNDAGQQREAGSGGLESGVDR